MTNKQPEEGKGGLFKEERSNGNARRIGGADSLASYGSLAETIECVISAGAYISFGRTSDGGATVLRVLDGDKKLTSYCSSRADVLEAMEALKQRYKPVDYSQTTFTATPPLKQPQLPKN